MSERKVRAYSSYSRDALIPPPEGEGVAWLGRQPWAEASLSYRALRLTLRVVLGTFGMRVRAVGLDRLATSGPRILVGAPHRRYYEAFALELRPITDIKSLKLLIKPDGENLLVMVSK